MSNLVINFFIRNKKKLNKSAHIRKGAALTTKFHMHGRCRAWVTDKRAVRIVADIPVRTIQE